MNLLFTKEHENHSVEQASRLSNRRFSNKTIPSPRFFYLIMLFYIFPLIILFSPIIAHSQMMTKPPSQLFLEANQAYEKENFANAANLYEEVIRSGIQSGMLYYNLGNCYTKQGEIGKALLNYRRAERLMTRDGDLKFNLRYVLDQRKDTIETRDRPDLLKVFFFWYYWLSLREFCYLFIIANLFLWALSILLIYKKNDPLRWMRIIALCLFLLSGTSLAVKVYEQRIVHSGVVIATEATIRSGNGQNHSALFILHEGAEFEVDEKTEDWLKISLPDGKIGWISAEDAEII